MSTGKTIRIYLADASVSGIRHAEIVNWTGQAISCPRTRFAELKEWPQVQRLGVYFLFGVDEDLGRDVLYIGEAEIVIDRVSSHISGKDFWSELVTFTSKDDNLTKGHVRYLEARLVQLASDAGRYVVKNATSPQLPSLPRADRDAMEEFIEGIRTLLGVLGHRALEPLTSRPAAQPTLQAERDAIEAEIGETLQWNPNPEKRDKTIALSRKADLNDRSKWPEYCDWLVDRVDRFRRAFGPRIKKLDLSEGVGVDE